MTFRQGIVAMSVAACLTVAVAARASAQEPAQTRHVVDQSVLQNAVANKVATDAADRALVLSAVHQPRVQVMANSLGLTPSRMDAAVATMSASELRTAAGPAAMAASAEAGGDVVIIGVTTLLLLLILLVLILK